MSREEFIKESLKELDRKDVKTVGNYLEKLALIYIFTDPKFLKEYSGTFSIRLKNMVYKPEKLFNLTLEDIIPELDFSDKFINKRFDIQASNPQLKNRIRERMIDRIRYYMNILTINFSKMILYSKRNIDIVKKIKNPLENNTSEEILTEYDNLAFAIKSNCSFENDINNYISLDTWEYIPYEESGKLYCIPIYYDGIKNPYTGVPLSEGFLENRNKYIAKQEILSKKVIIPDIPSKTQQDLENMNDLQLYYLVYNKINKKHIPIPSFLKNLEKDELINIYLSPDFIPYSNFDDSYIADLDLLILRKIPGKHTIFEYNNNIILGNPFDVLEYEDDLDYKFPQWTPRLSREEFKILEKPKIIDILLNDKFQRKVPYEYLSENFSRKQLIDIYFAPRCNPKKGIFCERGAICDSELNCCIRILPYDYDLRFYKDNVFAGSERILREYFDKVIAIEKKDEEEKLQEDILKEQEIQDKQKYETMIANLLKNINIKLSYGENKIVSKPTGLNINNVVIKNLSGPVSSYILKPTKKGFISMMATFDIKIPVLFMLGDMHGSFGGNCKDVIRPKDNQGARTYNITDPEFLGLLDSLYTKETPVDFYCEYFSQLYGEEKQFMFNDYSTKLLLDNKNCFYKRNDKKIIDELGNDINKCPTQNMKWHFGDPREIRNIFDIDLQRLNILASYNINLFISGVLDAVEYNLRGLNPENYQEKRHKLSTILANISSKLKEYDISKIRKLFLILCNPMNFSDREIVTKVILQEEFSNISVVHKQFEKQNQKFKKLIFMWLEKYIEYFKNSILSKETPNETNNEFVDILTDAFEGKSYDIDKLITIFTSNRSLQNYIITLVSAVSDAYIILRMFKVISDEMSSLTVLYLGSEHINNLIYMFVRIMKIYDIQIIQDNKGERCITFNDDINLKRLIDKYSKIKIKDECKRCSKNLYDKSFNTIVETKGIYELIKLCSTECLRKWDLGDDEEDDE